MGVSALKKWGGGGGGGGGHGPPGPPGSAAYAMKKLIYVPAKGAGGIVKDPTIVVLF